MNRAFAPILKLFRSPQIRSILPTHTSSTRAYATIPDAKGKLSFRDLTRKYGVTALGIYLTFTFIIFSACYTSVVILDIDTDQIQSVASKVKTFVGFEPSPPPIVSIPNVSDTTVPNADTGFYARTVSALNLSDSAQKRLTQVFIALLMTKLFSPLKFLATAMVTPIVARRMQGVGLDLGRRGVRDVGADARDRLKSKVANTLRKKDL